MHESVISVRDRVLREIKALPDHSPEEVAAAKKRLLGMAYRVPVDFTQENFLDLTVEGLKSEIERIISMADDDLRARHAAVESWSGTPGEADQNRVKRIEFLMREYRNLYLLRSGDARASDTSNELCSGD